MFIGHFAVGFAAVSLAPRSSLATLVLAAQLPDVLWPVFVLADWEHVDIAPGDTAFVPLRFDSYPYSHSLLTVALCGAILGALHYSSARELRTAFDRGAQRSWSLGFVRSDRVHDGGLLRQRIRSDAAERECGGVERTRRRVGVAALVRLGRPRPAGHRSSSSVSARRTRRSSPEERDTRASAP